jgi:hypothetical protein
MSNVRFLGGLPDGIQCACQDCGWEGPADDVGDIADVQERIGAGEIVPAGQCPECGALAQPIDFGVASELSAFKAERDIAYESAAKADDNIEKLAGVMRELIAVLTEMRDGRGNGIKALVTIKHAEHLLQEIPQCRTTSPTASP